MPVLIPNAYTVNLIDKAMTEGVSTKTNTADPKMELDPHANMVVLGRDTFIFEPTGRKRNVRLFLDDIGTDHDVPMEETHKLSPEHEIEWAKLPS